MTMKVETPPIKEKHDMTAGILARAGQILFMLIFLGLVLFLGSGYLNWTAAWVYLGISLLGILINATFLLRTKPEMVAERGKPKEMKGWDKLVSGLMALTQYLLLPLVAALDLRFGWTREYSRVWQGLGGLVYAGGLGLTSWAMIANAYFSTAVRIQSDRGANSVQHWTLPLCTPPGICGIHFLCARDGHPAGFAVGFDTCNFSLFLDNDPNIVGGLHAAGGIARV